MKNKERWLNAINCKPNDRLIFWPKLYGDGYINAQVEPYNKMKLRELHDYIGSDIFFYLPNYVQFDNGDCSVKLRKEGKYIIKEYFTPIGNMRDMLEFDVPSCSYHPYEFAIKDKEDIKKMTFFFDNLTPVINDDMFNNSKAFVKACGDRGIVGDNVSESPLMYFIEWNAGIQNGQYMLADYPDETSALMNSMQRMNIEMARLKNEHSPADILFFTENTSTTIISPNQFNKHSKEHLKEYAKISKEYDRTLLFHMCGHLGALLEDIDEVDFAGIEAFTTPPVGNSTIKMGKEKLTDKCIIGCTNCNTWTKPVKEIIDEIGASLAEVDDYNGIIIGTGGIIPSTCKPETLKQVREHLFSLPFK